MTGSRGKQRQLGLPDLTGRIPPKSAGPLPARQPAPDGEGEWYAVTDDGGSALRIRSGLHIGETEHGALVFNDGLRERRWVALEITADGGCVAQVADETHCLVDEDGRTHRRHALSPGATLAFPGNTLRISEHIARPARPGPRLAVQAAPESTVEPTDRTADAVAVDAAGPAEPIAPTTASPPRQGEPEPEVAPALSARRWKVGAGVAAGGILIGALLVWPFLQDRPNGPSTATVAAPAVAPVEPVEIPPVARRPVAVPLVPIDLDDLPPPRPLPAPAVATAEEPAAAEQPAAAAEPVFAAELGRARELLEAGYITYPPDANAVAVLIGILQRQPGHPEAMAMLGECTTRLIDAAIEAREQGLAYEARNLLEEVRGFNPDNERANRLWREWQQP